MSHAKPPIPAILYHGSPREFDKFDLGYFGRVDDGYYGVGIYFSCTIEHANEYGPWIYQAKLLNPRPFYLWDDPSCGNTYQARLELSELPEYADIAPNLEIPAGYELQWAEDEGNGFRRPIKGWRVYPLPETYDDPDCSYGEIAPTKEQAIVKFNDERKYGYNRGPGNCGWTSGLLKYVGRNDFTKVVSRHGYNCVAMYDDSGLSEVLVTDPGIIKVEKRFFQRNKYDTYEDRKTMKPSAAEFVDKLFETYRTGAGTECPNCSRPLVSGARRCDSCGKKVERVRIEGAPKSYHYWHLRTDGSGRHFLRVIGGDRHFFSTKKRIIRVR